MCACPSAKAGAQGHRYRLAALGSRFRVAFARTTLPLIGSTPVERRHHVLGEPAQLLLELVGGQALGPVDHEILEPRIFRLDRLDAVDDVRRRSAEPRLLLYAI